MPSLIVDYQGNHRGGIIPARVLIGRLPSNGICLPESHVSRLHAWIENDQGRCFLADVGSLTGTTVNDAEVGARQLLKDNDTIRIGAATIVYRESGDLPYGIAPMSLEEQPPSLDIAAAGILFDCPCGAPHWVKANVAGRRGQCHRCREMILIPSLPGSMAQLVPSEETGDIQTQFESPVYLDEDSSADAGGSGDLPRSALPAAAPAAAPRRARPMFPGDAVNDLQPTTNTVKEKAAGRGAQTTRRRPEAPWEMLDDSVAPITGPEPGVPAVSRARPPGAQSTDYDDGVAEFTGDPTGGTVSNPRQRTNGDDGTESGRRPGADTPVQTRPHSESGPHSESELEFLDSPDAPHASVNAAVDPAATAGGDRAGDDADPCSICRGTIAAGDARHVCPECGLTFHAECWLENRGCSAYGCAQVGVLERRDQDERTLEFDDAALTPGGEAATASAGAAATASITGAAADFAAGAHATNDSQESPVDDATAAAAKSSRRPADRSNASGAPSGTKPPESSASPEAGLVPTSSAAGAAAPDDQLAAEAGADEAAPLNYMSAGSSAAASAAADEAPVIWDSLFLLTAVIGALAGAFTFGAPSLVAALGTALYLLTGRPPGRRGTVVGALVISIVAMFAGVWFSYFWLFQVKHLKWK